MIRLPRPAPVLVALLLATPAPAHAQVLIGYLFGEKLASPTFNMGFEVGINFGTVNGMGTAHRANKTVFGLFADWRFSEHFHLGSALLPFAGRGADELAPVLTGDAAIDNQISQSTMNRTMHLIEVPVILKWAPKRETGFRVGVGPSIGFITGANDRYQTSTASGSAFILERDIGPELPAIDFGLSAEVEYRLPILSIAARYTHGLTDVRSANQSGAVHTRTLTGTGRIYLGKKKAGK
ncbi:MAG TPA: porin family protein [Gemmatimonadales bacterium]|nr:porin family protein [Gemmatimonadales bacterium]